ncbi:MAG: hypothetical protein GXP03_12810 [Alphaproteobacteria bacterium]|nr:hypothetical protein [Alphaproteobacteria bacterium]
MRKIIAALAFLFISLPFTASAQQLDASECISTKSIIDDMFQGSFCMKMRRGPFYVRIPATMTVEIGGKTQDYVAWAPVVPLNSGPRYNPGHCYWQRYDPQGALIDVVGFNCSFTKNNDGRIESKSAAKLSVTYAKTEGEDFKEILVTLVISVDGKNLLLPLFRNDIPGKACLAPDCKSEIRALDIPDAGVLDDIMLVDFGYEFDLLDSEDPDFEPLRAIIQVKGFASRYRW